MSDLLTKVGRFEIVSLIGRGSMGIVYKGFDPVIGRTVAIKTMQSEGIAGPELEEFRRRFQVEAQAAGGLTHPNIVTIYDFGFDEPSSVLYMAMEYLEGKSLQRLVDEEGVLPVETIIPMLEQICAGLGYAHQGKIVHRDIKPANIMVLTSGLIKLMDFGIAKVASSGLTQAGQILGTPHYMSPEQVKGRQIDGRSDIFSLGVIIYELMTGEKPFGGQNITTVIYKIINESPTPPRELDAAIHPGLNYVISKALAKRVEDRYQSCGELAEDLKNYRKLGPLAEPSATIMTRVPTFGDTVSTRAIRPEPTPPPSVPTAPVAGSISPKAPPRAGSVHVVPSPRPKQSSSFLVMLLTLVVVALFGVVAYFLYFPTLPVREATLTQPPPAQELPRPPLPEGAPGAGGELGLEGIPAGTPQDLLAEDAGVPPFEREPAPPVAETPPPEPEPKRPAETAPREVAASPPKTVTPPPRRVIKPGTLKVSSTPAGAKITLDGKAAGVTPKEFSLPAGTHKLQFDRSGYEVTIRLVDLKGGGTRPLAVEMRRLEGSVVIRTSPLGADVFINGQRRGTTPLTVELPPGDFRYSVQKAGYEPFQGSFSIEHGSRVRKSVILAPGRGPSMGVVEVRTIPPAASVAIDGEAVGGKTPTSFRLTAGRHVLVVPRPGYQPLRRVVDVPADAAISINVKLSPAR